MGLIEEVELENKEEENENGLLDFGNEDCPFKEMLDGVIEDQEVLEERVDKLEEKFKNKLDTIATLEDEIKKFKEWQSSFLAKYYVDKAKENKTASSKKK
jgi:FtsZ-binding cell division protein ZapB